MGEFFFRREAGANESWVYSERGLISYLIQHVLLSDPYPVLRAATNGHESLYEATGAPFLRYATIGEFDLGKQGFGCPDGGLLGIHEDLEQVFVFIEAKAVVEKACYADPAVVAKRIEEVDWNDISDDALRRLLEKNAFNSSLNGQIEMRWRFVNALLQGARGVEMRITEQAVPRLPHDLQVTDRFYWNRRLRPRADKISDWRRVRMTETRETNLLPLYEKLRGPQTKFFLLAITPDDRPPAAIQAARLFSPQGDQVDVSMFVYWLPLRFITDPLQRL